jgi:hypothetical protein
MSEEKTLFPLSVSISSPEQLESLPPGILAGEITRLNRALKTKEAECRAAESRAANAGDLAGEKAQLSQQLKEAGEKYEEEKNQATKAGRERDEAQYEVNILRKIIFPQGLSEDAYFASISQQAAAGGELDALANKKIPLLLLFAGLTHAPTPEVPELLAFMGKVAALTEGGAGAEVRTQDAWERMEAVAELCNQVCQRTARPWQVKMPALNDTVSTGWVSAKPEGATRGRIRCVYNWAVMTGDGKTNSYAIVSC